MPSTGNGDSWSFTYYLKDNSKNTLLVFENMLLGAWGTMLQQENEQ